jgi:5'-methylthioadenosine phosphorylase
METIDIGVLGGSGFYKFGEDIEEIKIDTPYGAPSAKLVLATIEGKRVAFLPRHGADHSLPPHQINYRANIWAMKQLGVTRLFGPCAAGSLQVDVKPGEFVLCDQFVDRTKGRIDTFYDGPITTHISCADPYCSQMRQFGKKVADDLGIIAHDHGTVVVINGPRFSTKAESKWFSDQGWEVINMTQYPEQVLARELEMCFMNISLITDYDAGVEGVEKPQSTQEIIAVFMANLDHLKKFLFKAIKDLPVERTCTCGEALKFARFND